MRLYNMYYSILCNKRTKSLNSFFISHFEILEKSKLAVSVFSFENHACINACWNGSKNGAHSTLFRKAFIGNIIIFLLLYALQISWLMKMCRWALHKISKMYHMLSFTPHMFNPENVSMYLGEKVVWVANITRLISFFPPCTIRLIRGVNCFNVVCLIWSGAYLA